MGNFDQQLTLSIMIPTMLGPERCPPTFIFWSLNHPPNPLPSPPRSGVWGRGLWEVLRFQWSHDPLYSLLGPISCLLRDNFTFEISVLVSPSWSDSLPRIPARITWGHYKISEYQSPGCTLRDPDIFDCGVRGWELYSSRPFAAAASLVHRLRQPTLAPPKPQGLQPLIPFPASHTVPGILFLHFLPSPHHGWKIPPGLFCVVGTGVFETWHP